jgi:hypothetical protein
VVRRVTLSIMIHPDSDLRFVSPDIGWGVAQPHGDILGERTEIEAALRDPSLLRIIQHHFPSLTPK